jgi:hypothetical protein
LATRNHAATVRSSLQGWRAALPQAEVQWWLLDLGSTDDTVALVEDESWLRIVHHAGGLVRPLAALAHVLRETSAEIVVLADADAPPSDVVNTLVQAVRSGPALASAPQRYPALLAVSRPQWLREAVSPESLAPWARAHGGHRRLGAVRGVAQQTSLVQRLLPEHRGEHLAARLPALLQPHVERLLRLLPRRA